MKSIPNSGIENWEIPVFLSKIGHFWLNFWPIFGQFLPIFYKNEIVEVLLVEINSNKLDIIFFINIEKHRISQIFTADYVFVIMDDIRSIY